jgi:hypothetical protein
MQHIDNILRDVIAHEWMFSKDHVDSLRKYLDHLSHSANTSNTADPVLANHFKGGSEYADTKKNFSPSSLLTGDDLFVVLGTDLMLDTLGLKETFTSVVNLGVLSPF